MSLIMTKTGPEIVGPKEKQTILREVRLDPETIYRDEVV